MSDPAENAREAVLAAEATAAARERSVMGRLRNYFLTGLVIAGPLFVTFYLTWWFIRWVDDLVRPFVPPALRLETYTPVQVPGTGLIIALVALTLLGFLAANLVGRTLVDLGDRLLSRMPVVRPIYKMMKQIFETLFSKTGSSFRKVALVEFPSPGMWSIVLLSTEPGEGIAARLPESDYVSAFLPCTPNPTTGFFFYVPRAKLIDIDITVEQAMTLLISAGVVQPDGESQKKLAAMAAQAKAAAHSPALAR